MSAVLRMVNWVDAIVNFIFTESNSFSALIMALKYRLQLTWE